MNRAIFMLVLLAFCLIGCAGNQSPTQKYRNAVLLYDTTIATATFAINNDDVDLQEAESIAALEALSYSKLVEAREALRIDPQAPVIGILDQVLAALHTIKSLYEPPEPDPVLDEPDPLPLPSRPSE